MQIRERDGVEIAVVCEDDLRNPHFDDNLQRLIEKLKRGRLVVDLSRVESITGLGVALLIVARGLAMIHKTRIAFAAVSPRVRRALGLAEADQVLALWNTVEEALRSLRDQGARISA